MPEALCPCPAGLRRDADRPACVNALLSPCPGGIRTSEAAILPYVPYPTCLATGSLPATHLPVLQPRRTSQSGALMTDPITGIEVPVLAVTLHPQTRQWLTLGGAYRNPLTQTLAPLELGGPMEDPVTGGISPILGVGLDENTGLLVARVPSFCPSSLWSGFPSPSPQHPRPSTFWSSLQPPPEACPYFHPSCSGCLSSPSRFPSPSSSAQCPPPRPGWEAGVRTELLLQQKHMDGFLSGKTFLLPPALPHPRLCPIPRPPPPSCHSLCPGHPPPHRRFSLASPTSIPSRIPLSLVLASRPGACTGRTSRCLGEPPAAW